MDVSPSVDLDRFAERIRRSTSEKAFDSLLAEVRAQRDGGLAILRALMRHGSSQANFWAAGVARSELGADAVPLLIEMANDRRTFTRDIAMQELAAIDIELLRPFVPAMRRTLLQSKPTAPLYSPGGAAMWRLVRLRDRESASTFRAFAEKQEHGRNYAYRMPIVLADYLDDPNSLLRRIQSHDHEWMRWLVQAAAQVNVPGIDNALVDGGANLPPTLGGVSRRLARRRAPLRCTTNRAAATLTDIGAPTERSYRWHVIPDRSARLIPQSERIRSVSMRRTL
jgi:hypothetical protein